ncbi:cilia-and flagella-associated protein 57, partial [Trichonephila clavata]
TDYSNKLQLEALELTVEGDHKIKECQLELENKENELAEVKQKLQKIKDSHKELSAILKIRKREEIVLNERLKSTEKSVIENTRKVMAAEIYLERYRLEFVSSTSECPSASALRWAMLRLYEKRVAKTRIKEETLFFDTDPVIRFHNQIDHYQFLINTIKNRTAQIKNTFRENFVKLAKENSDWTAFAEAIRANIRSKRERIRHLEEGLDLKKEEFNRNPAETQRRLLQTYENLRHLEEEEHRQIDQRMTLIEEQEKEIQRLHGLLTVEEKGKIVRKMRL